MCIFDAGIGEALGIDIKSGQHTTFRGVQNANPDQAYLNKLNLKVGGHEITIPVLFSYNLSTSGYGILGQKGFFDIFMVKFDLAKEEVELKERK